MTVVLERPAGPDQAETFMSSGSPSPGSVEWTAHPLIDRYPEFRRLSDEQYARLVREGGVDAATAYVAAREQRIADSQRDPCNHEFPLPHWAELESAVLRSLVTFIPGGNNPGKSRWAASFVMRVLLRRITWPDIAPDGRIKVLMVAQDDSASKLFQHDKVYEMMPAPWRALNESQKKPPGFARCINYSSKNGFTEGNFVLPKGLKGQCWFRTVAQYVREPQSFQGADFDLVIIDEGAPLPLLKTLEERVGKRGGKVIYLLTCVGGYDQALGKAFEGAKLVKTLPMQFDWLANGLESGVSGLKSTRTDGGSDFRRGTLDARLSGGINPEIAYPELRIGEHQSDLLKRLGCPAGHMPYLMQPLNPHHRIVFMWNVWNPFQPRGRWNPKMPAMMDSCIGDPKWRVLVKMFGWIERLGQLALGNFNPERHVVRGEQREKLDALIRAGKASVYLGDDPETQRSHAVLWLAVFPPEPAWPNGLKYLFDESPRVKEGEWVDGNGCRGEGQYIYRATGSNWYKRYLREREKEWGICDEQVAQPSGLAALHYCIISRRGDPRGFATEASTATGTRKLFELYYEDHGDEHPAYAPMFFVRVPLQRSSSLDIDNVINLLKYDEDKYTANGGFTAENTPQLLISERCENFIRCALNYTLTDLGKADEDNPYRDFIDALRYLLAMDTPYLDLNRSNVRGGGAIGAF